MTTLHCLRGYPGSGKSTLARTLPGVVVGRDYLRFQMFGKYRLDEDGEQAVTVAQQAMVRALLAAGTDVVIDDMNVNGRYLRDWAKVAREFGADFTVHDVRTPVWECIERDINRDAEKYVSEAVIEKIAKRWPMEKWPTVRVNPKPTVELVPYVPKPNTPPAIIVDIDGTLAHHGPDGRSPFDYSRVSEDVVDETVREIVNHEWARGTLVIVCSGRDSTCYRDTEKWLVNNGVSFDVLLMRGEEQDEQGNKLPDWIVKAGIFDLSIRDLYTVKYVLDDRQQVVDMWRALGLKCLQVAPGNF